jgi:DnaJ-class molecular chaperone
LFGTLGGTVQAIDAVPSSACPSCGGAGGGPFGRLGGAWDTEDYVCPRCQGSGVVALAHAGDVPKSQRPSIAKTTPGSAQEREHAASSSTAERGRDGKKRALGD